MKRLLTILFVFLSVYGRCQVSPTQVQAKRGVFTERLSINGNRIDRISTDLNTGDSASDNVLATGKAVADFFRPRTGYSIQKQYAAAQPANIWTQGRAVIGPVGNYMNNLTSGLPAQVYVTYSLMQQGLAVQRSSADQGPASIVLFKNNASDLNTLNALQPGDKIGSLAFSAHSADLTDVRNVIDIHGLVEKTAPSYLSSGFVFNTVDTGGNYAQRMWLNAGGNLLLGNGTTNPYRLNVADGNVRFNSLAGSGDGLVSVNSEGVLTKLQLGDNLFIEEGELYSTVSSMTEGGFMYRAVLSQSGQDAPVAKILESTRSVGQVTWTRNSTGNYTATVPNGSFGEMQYYHAEASDEAGNVLTARFFRSGGNTYTLIVRDNTLSTMDGWTNISIEVRGYNYN